MRLYLKVYSSIVSWTLYTSMFSTEEFGSHDGTLSLFPKQKPMFRRFPGWSLYGNMTSSSPHPGSRKRRLSKVMMMFFFLIIVIFRGLINRKGRRGVLSPPLNACRAACQISSGDSESPPPPSGGVGCSGSAGLSVGVEGSDWFSTLRL